MTKRTMTKEQTMTYKPLHRKLKIEQHELNLKEKEPLECARE
jgi:hypothetical protein